MIWHGKIVLQVNSRYSNVRKLMRAGKDCCSMNPYAKSLQKLYLKHADPEKAAPMKAYMRNQFDYLGIQSPQLAQINKEFFEQHGLPELARLEKILGDLWALPEREYQYAALGLLHRMEKELPSDFVQVLEFLLITKSWWDTVDSLAGGTIGFHFKRFPRVKEKYIARWRMSENIWLRRTTLLFQLSYKNDTDFPLMCNLIRDNLGSKEFFINKAIGWALRQYSRVDPQSVSSFVKETPLHPLSKREALKWIEKRKSMV
jgi:3-methyladenine DNA glycosylase AlkD